MINHELRKQGCGGSDVAAIIGLSPYADAFSVWADKLELVERPEPTIRQRKGKFFESAICAWYSDETGNPTEWFDTTVQHPERPFMVCTPDAWVLDGSGARVGLMDSKLVGFQNYDQWGEPGTDKVPDHYAIQAQWNCSTTEKPWLDLAAALGDELRVYRIHRDPAIEAVLLEVVERFWKENVLGQTQPPIGATDTATAYLKKRFPKQVEPLRVATPEEADLMAAYKLAREEWDAMEARYDPLENRIREVIGDSEGIINGSWRITFKKDANSTGTDWYAVAKALACVPCLGPFTDHTECVACQGTGWVLDAAGHERLRAMEAAHQVITRQGPRKLRATFGKKK